MKSFALLTASALVGTSLTSSVVLAQQARDAPNWARIQTENEQEAVTYVDLKSIRAGNGYRHVWVKEIFKADRNAVSEIRAQYEVDCKDPSVRVLRSRTHQRNGSIMVRDEIEKWVVVLSDDESGVKALHRAVCNARVPA